VDEGVSGAVVALEDKGERQIARADKAAGQAGVGHVEKLRGAGDGIALVSELPAAGGEGLVVEANQRVGRGR